MNFNLQVPFIFWNKNSPEIVHKVTVINYNKGVVCTGSETGEVCIWHKDKQEFIPDLMCCIGHEAECRELSFCKAPFPELTGSQNWVVSVHTDNVLRAWDLQDGKCISASSDDLLPKESSFDLMHSVQERALVIGGDTAEAFLVDPWTMQLLATLCLPNIVVGLDVADFQQSSEVTLIDSEGEIAIWEVPSLKETNSISISEDPKYKLTMKTEESPTQITTSHKNKLLAILYKKVISFVHHSWIDKAYRDEAYLELEEEAAGVFFFSKYFLVLSESGTVSFYNCSEILDSMQNSKLTNHFKLNLVVQRKYELQNFGGARVFCKGTLITGQTNSISFFKLKSLKNSQEVHPKSFSLSLHKVPFENFADNRVQHLLQIEEWITDSTFIFTNTQPYYLLGTSLGNIFVCPFLSSQAVLTYSYHKAPITCMILAESKLVTCSEDNLMCVWEFEPKVVDDTDEDVNVKAPLLARSRSFQCSNPSSSKYETTGHHPIQTINLWGSCIRKLVPVKPINGYGVKDWEKTLLAQCTDGSILLVSLVTNCVICHFQALSSSIREAEVHAPLEYLLVTCEDYLVYVFNMAVQALERIVSRKDVSTIFKKSFKGSLQYESFDDMDVNVSELHKLVLYNLRSHFYIRSPNPIFIKNVSIGGSRFTFFCVNISSISSSVAYYLASTKHIECILSLITCWDQCQPNLVLMEAIENILSVEKPALVVQVGSLGCKSCFSFPLPKPRNNFDISTSITGTLVNAQMLMLSGLSGLHPSIKPFLKKLSETISGTPVHRNSFMHINLVTTAILSLRGYRNARTLLRQGSTYMNPVQKEELIKETSKCLSELKPTTQGRRSLTYMPGVYRTPIKGLGQRNYVGFVEALSCCLLGYAELGASTVKEGLLKALRRMLKSGNEGYVKVAADLLRKGVPYWRGLMSPGVAKEVQKELIANANTEPRLFYKAVVSIAASDFGAFLEVVVENLNSKDQNAIICCLEALEEFIKKHYDEVAVFLVSVVEIILSAIDPQDSFLRKKCFQKVQQTLQQLIVKLPMVTFSQEKQRLGIGLLDRKICIYDMKTTSKLKEFEAHQGPVSALEFSETGNYIASYSSEDLTLKVWKTETGFFSGLLGTLEVSQLQNIELPEIEPENSKYSDFLDVISIIWSENNRGVVLVREDGNDYNFMID